MDNNLERASNVAERFQVRAYLTDYRQILGSVDGVIVATPHHLHYSISKDFLAAGVHVLCEKPLTETGAEAREIIDLAQEKGVTISVNNTRRLYPSSGKVKQLLANKEIGRILSITYFEGGEFAWPTVSGFYFNPLFSKKGVLLDLGAHVFDLLCWWLGAKPRLVSSENDSFGGCEAVASVILEHEGCRCEIRLSRLSKLPNYFRIRGDRGAIEGSVYDTKTVVLSTTTPSGREKSIQLRASVSPDISAKLVTNFLDVIRNNGEPLIPAREVLDSIELLEEAYTGATRFSMPWYDFRVKRINV